MVKNPPANAGDISNVGLIPGLGRFPGEANTTLLYSCLENPTDRGTWQATVHRVAHSWTRLKWLSTAQTVAWEYPVVPTPLSFPTELSYHPRWKSNWPTMNWVYFWTLDSIPLIFAYPYAGTLSKLGNQEMWGLQFCSFPVLFWLFMVLFISIWILGSAYQFLKNTRWGFDRDCTESVDQFGEYYYVNNIQSSDLWSWDVFAFIRYIFTFFKQYFGTFLVVQWLGLHGPNAVGKGLIPGWETKIIPTCCMAWPKKPEQCFDSVLHWC